MDSSFHLVARLSGLNDGQIWRLVAEVSCQKVGLLKAPQIFLVKSFHNPVCQKATGQKAKGTVYANSGLAEDQDVNLSFNLDWKLTDMQRAIVLSEAFRIDRRALRSSRDNLILTRDGKLML